MILCSCSINKHGISAFSILRRPIIRHTTSTTTSLSNELPGSSASTKTKQQRSKEKRAEFIGMAKAVDRGQWSNIYQPMQNNTMTAKSGLPDMTREFIVLGIESSCDDTGAAIVSSNGTILGEALASQSSIHEPFGGVVPNLAMQAHIDAIDVVVKDALKNAGLTSVDQVDAIGVTVGPGLEICLRVGTNKAKELALQYNKPFVGVHHLEAHILMARLPILEHASAATTTTTTSHIHIPATETTHAMTRALEFPFLALLTSGGHCLLLKCKGIGQYETIGGTIDDSLGEAFDKTARLLGLPIGGGGGPAVEQLAKDGNPKSVPLTVPMQKHRTNCDFSYAGLKTNIRRAAEKMASEQQLESVDQLPYQDKANLAASFQHVAILHIEQRLVRAMILMEQEDIKKLVVVGGVAANQELRTRLNNVCAEREWEMRVPPPRLCTDQGAMSAWAAIERLVVGSSDEAEGQQVFARYPFWSPPRL